MTVDGPTIKLTIRTTVGFVEFRMAPGQDACGRGYDYDECDERKKANSCGANYRGISFGLMGFQIAFFS